MNTSLKQMYFWISVTIPPKNDTTYSLWHRRKVTLPWGKAKLSQPARQLSFAFSKAKLLFFCVKDCKGLFTSRPIHFCFTRSTINHSWIIHSQEMNGFVVPLVLKGCTRAGWVRSPWRYIAAKVINTPPKPGPFGWQSLVGQHLYLCRLRIWLEIAFLTLAGCTTLGGTRNGHLAATRGAPEAIWGLCLASRTKYQKIFLKKSNSPKKTQ